jgi:hypothetical protein
MRDNYRDPTENSYDIEMLEYRRDDEIRLKYNISKRDGMLLMLNQCRYKVHMLIGPSMFP